ncbi:hypothetical protein DS901_17260 [Loktanella sp. D2R18]|uniref:YcaO-like family protein n=1 Tax=Rhodobacterales TaxID=204455 RepID=UPI000DEB0651|nr:MULTISPECIES: YcaO-like family protein [Rhodobacterales]MDO6591221.1 YcaO-like family protein [Yoonia sp. 1_MG-2023]RBW41484.1 hypothetical protein DS901_17260 [Loktanella sp. D2R18]
MNDRVDAAKLTEALVSRRCGIVTDLSPQARGPEEPSPPHLWNATLTNYNFQTVPLAMRLTGGKGLTEEAAKLAALGEAMERYSAFHWDPARLHVGPASDTAITPAESVLYSADQYAAGLPYQPWSRTNQTSWIKGTELPPGAAVDMPASLVYLVGPPPNPADYFTAVTSNGLAAGRDLPHAILGGLNEVIERDAFMITWLNRLPATTIATPQSGCNAAQIIRHYDRFGVKVRLLSLYTDQAPYVIMAIAEEPTGYRLVGLGCDLDPAGAVDKAMFELCQLRPGMAARMHGNDYQTRLKSYKDVQSIDDHPLFHAIPANAGEFDFLTQTGATVTLDDMPRPSYATNQEALTLTVDAAVKTGARVAYADITAPDIAPLGPRVVRVIATGMQPIHFGHDQGRFGGARLYDAPVTWGLRDTPLTKAGLNPCPHPLA